MQYRDGWDGFFTARLTAVDEDGLYDFEEVVADTATPGEYITVEGGRQGTGCVHELNGGVVGVPAVVMLRYRTMSGGNIHYEFDAGIGVPTLVKVTSETVDADGNYPAVTTVWNTTTEVWDDSATVVKLKAANDEALVSGNRYVSVPFGLNTDDERVYVMDGGAGGETPVWLVTNVCPVFDDETGTSGVYLHAGDAAGGDLGGTYPNPTVINVDGGTF